MSYLPNLIADVVKLAGGRLVGRTRLQKTLYLLDARGLQSGAAYYYYNFGPFSDEIAAGISDGKFSGILAERIQYRQSDGSPFSIFETDPGILQPERVGALPRAEVSRIVERLGTANAIVLELAATIHWLTFVEKVPDWRRELRRRKGAKTDGGRVEKAVGLLGDLGVVVN